MTLLQTYLSSPAACTIICHLSYTLTCKQSACTNGCFKIPFFLCLSNNIMSCLRRLCCQLPWSWPLLNEPKTTWFCYIVSEQRNSSCLLSWLLLVSLYKRHLKRCMWIWVCVFCTWSSLAALCSVCLRILLQWRASCTWSVQKVRAVGL